MVDMRASNAKLRRRAEAIVCEIARCPESEAARYVAQADGDVKTAVLLGLGLDPGEAARLLRRHGGNLRKAIGHGASTPSPPSAGEGRDEGASPRTPNARTDPSPRPSPRKSGERERNHRRGGRSHDD
jgi:N-acetylmuramic acid 6-phosphate etherase